MDATLADVVLVLEHNHGFVFSEEAIEQAKKSEELKNPKRELEFDGSGSERWSDQETWTEAGQDKEGFPVEKGSEEDVTESADEHKE